MAKTTKRPVPATHFPNEAPTATPDSVILSAAQDLAPDEQQPTAGETPETVNEMTPPDVTSTDAPADANPESVASETETAAADPDVIVITGDSTIPTAANPESLDLPIVEQHIEPEPVVYQPDGPDNAAGAPIGVHLEHLTVPVKRSVGYAPTAISLNLTGNQARMLADIAEGLTACGEKLAHPSDAINLILDHLADND